MCGDDAHEVGFFVESGGGGWEVEVVPGEGCELAVDGLQGVGSEEDELASEVVQGVRLAVVGLVEGFHLFDAGAVGGVAAGLGEGVECAAVALGLAEEGVEGLEAEAVGIEDGEEVVGLEVGLHVAEYVVEVELVGPGFEPLAGRAAAVGEGDDLGVDVAEGVAEVGGQLVGGHVGEEEHAGPGVEVFEADEEGDLDLHVDGVDEGGAAATGLGVVGGFVGGFAVEPGGDVDHLQTINN